MKKLYFIVFLLLSTHFLSAQVKVGPFNLNLPERAIPDRFSLKRGIASNSTATFAELKGPGCIQHIWLTLSHPQKTTMINRKIIIRIYFDGSEIPHVEAPVGDFFGVMHGQDFYEINSELLSVKQFSGYNCYFRMPFAKKARIEFEAGPERQHVYLQVDWHRYPGQSLEEDRRFCARWRRENPTQRYSDDFLMLDAEGPGQLVGFVFGLRLIDNKDRWSHGGAANVYIDGDGQYPVYLRGIGGEDEFGTSFGGAIHPPETHFYAAMPYYVHKDVGDTRPAQRLVGYRFFLRDQISFEKSIHMRFGCMENDICSTVYWFSTKPVRPFVKMPEFSKLIPGTELVGGEMDMPLPNTGIWQVAGPVEMQTEQISSAILENALANNLSWQDKKADHCFIDFNHVFQPHKRGVGIHYKNHIAFAKCQLDLPKKMQIRFKLAWDDQIAFSLNGNTTILDNHNAFRQQMITRECQKGLNDIVIGLTNTSGSNHGGWAFVLQAIGPQDELIYPKILK